MSKLIAVWGSPNSGKTSFTVKLALILADVNQHVPGKEIIICETNYQMNPRDCDSEETRAARYVDTAREALQAKFVADFTKKVYACTSEYPNLKGIIYYELLDQPQIEKKAGQWAGEAHFGFYRCDANGDNCIAKPAYYELRETINEIKAGV